MIDKIIESLESMAEDMRAMGDVEEASGVDSALWLIEEMTKKADTPQTEIGYCNECKWFGDKQVCGRCRNRNLFAVADTPQTCEDCDHWSDTQDGCADRHGCYTPQTDCDRK